MTPEQDALVRRYRPRIDALARRLHAYIPALDVESYASVGYVAACEAARRYDPTRGASFASFAYLRVRGAMIDALRRVNSTSRRQRRAAQALAMAQLGAEEAARRAGHGHHDPRSLEERVEAAAELVRSTTATVIISRAAAVDVEAAPAGDETLPEDQLLDAETATRVRRLVARLEPEERALVEALYFREQSMTEVAAARGTSKSTISRHHARILRKLARLIGEASPRDRPALPGREPDVDEARQRGHEARPRGPPDV